MFKVSDISKRFGKNYVLNGVSFDAVPGDAICLVGGNGCGKTTLLRILAGALKADEGTISFAGGTVRAAEGDAAFFKQYMGYVPQSEPLIEELTVMDNIRLWGISPKGFSAGYKASEGAFHSSSPAAACDGKASIDGFDDRAHGAVFGDICRSFGIDAYLKKRVSKLSGGMKRRVTLAIAFAPGPPVMLLDEPTNSLDIHGKEKVLSFLKAHRERGGIVIMSSHQKEEIAFCNRVFSME